MDDLQLLTQHLTRPLPDPGSCDARDYTGSSITDGRAPSVYFDAKESLSTVNVKSISLDEVTEELDKGAKAKGVISLNEGAAGIISLNSDSDDDFKLPVSTKKVKKKKLFVHKSSAHVLSLDDSLPDLETNYSPTLQWR